MQQGSFGVVDWPDPGRERVEDILFRVVAIGFPAFLLGYWLLAENHGVFGDEGWHLNFLFDAWGKPADTLRQRVWGLYVFNDQYPPLFYLLSVPFVFLFENHLVGARVYVAVLTAGVLWFFYRCLRLYVDRWTAMVGVYVLLTCGIFIEATRYYLLEMLLLLLLLVTAYLVVTWMRGGKTTTLALVSAVLAAGMMVKVNFAIYALPIGVVLLGSILRKARMRGGAVAVLKHAAIVLALPITTALPWYVQDFANPRSSLAALRAMQRAEHLAPVDAFDAMGRQIIASLIQYFPWFVYAALGVVVVAYVVDRARRTNRMQRDASDGIVVFSVIYATYLTVLLYRLGLGTTLRWNLSYALVPTLVAALLPYIRLGVLRIGLTLTLFVLSMLFIINNYVRPFTSVGLIVAPHAKSWQVPSATSTGMDVVAKLIDRNERALPSPSDNPTVLFLFHAHEGAHVGALGYYLARLGSNLRPFGVGFYNKPVDAKMLVQVHYIVRMARPMSTVDPEMYRYQRLADAWFSKDWSGFRRIGVVPTRFGDAEVYFRPNGRYSYSALRELVALGEAQESDPPYVAFWQLERVRLSALAGDVDLVRADFEALKKQYPSLRHQMNVAAFEQLDRSVRDTTELVSQIDRRARQPLAEAVENDAMLGSVDTVRARVDCVLVAGWAAELDRTGPVRELIFAVGDGVVGRTDKFSARDDVAEFYKAPALRKTGYEICIPRYEFVGLSGDLRVLARGIDGRLRQVHSQPLDLAW